MAQTRERPAAGAAGQGITSFHSRIDSPQNSSPKAQAQAEFAAPSADPNLASLLATIEVIGLRARSMAKISLGSDRDYSLCNLLEELDDLNSAISKVRLASGERTA